MPGIVIPAASLTTSGFGIGKFKNLDIYCIVYMMFKMIIENKMYRTKIQIQYLKLSY